MHTIDESLVRRNPKGPCERYISSQDVNRYLVTVRQNRITRDTFRRWRKVAQVTVTHAYSEFERARLAAVARHLFEGKSITKGAEAKQIELQIIRLLKQEKQWLTQQSNSTNYSNN